MISRLPLKSQSRTQDSTSTFGFDLAFLDDIEQQIQAVKEKDTRIEGLKIISKPTAYSVYLIVVPLLEKLIVSSESKPFVVVSSEEDIFVAVPRIDFVFGDQ